MPGSRRDEEFSAFVQDHRIDMLRAACLLAAGDTHRAEDLVQTALARLYVAWPRVRRSGSEAAYAWRIIVNAHLARVSGDHAPAQGVLPGGEGFSGSPGPMT